MPSKHVYHLLFNVLSVFVFTLSFLAFEPPKAEAVINSIYGHVQYGGMCIISCSGGTPVQGATLRTTISGSTRTVTTNASGDYSFGTVPTGSYTVILTMPAPDNRTFSLGGSAAQGSCSGTSTANCGILVANFPVTPLAPTATPTPTTGSNRNIQAGYVFVDTNKDGTKQTTESGYTGATVRMNNSSNGTSITGTTNSTGNYSLEMSGTGTFCIALAAVPAGYTATTTTGPTRCMTVTGSGNTTSNGFDFGIVQAATPTPIPPTATPTPTPTPTPILYTITGTVFNDVNKNGTQEAGEANYNGRPTIAASRGTVVTNTNGTYSITNLTAGTVTISYSNLPSGYTMTYPLNGPPSSFQVTVGPGCTTNGAKGASCQ